MDKVLERVALSTEPIAISTMVGDLMTRSGYRLNRVLPKDGTEDMIAALTIAPVTGTDPILYLNRAASTDEAYVKFQVAAVDEWTVGTQASLTHLDILNSSDALRVRIPQTGPILIGASLPAAGDGAGLHVHVSAVAGGAGNAASGIVIERATFPILELLSANTSVGQVRFSDPENSGRGFIQYAHSTNALSLGANGTTQLVLTSAAVEVQDGTVLRLLSTDAGAGAEPIMELYRNSASPAAADVLGQITFYGRDDDTTKQQYTSIFTKIADPADASIDGSLFLNCFVANTDTTVLALVGGLMQFGTHTGIGAEALSGYVTINDAGGTPRKVGVIS